MVFGKIAYLNLLPFHTFMKRYASSQAKAIMEHKKGVPSAINTRFSRRDVDAAFISSIKARKYNCVKLGIVAKKEVQSVLVLPNKTPKNDAASATSNTLLKVLQLQGEVLIGDNALHYAFHNDDYIDMASEWYKRYKLPFVFALLCYHKEKKSYKKIEKRFSRQPGKIPRYLLEKAAKQAGVTPKQALSYLKLISYKIDPKAQKGLQKFYRLVDSTR